ncbi:MAG TPA: flavoprotein, partial [bacterium]|nr:flavoprotein [bacterium]
MKTSNLKAKSLKNKTILHILTGSIAAYKAGDLIQVLRDQGVRIICVMTECAKAFVTPLTLRALSGQRVYHDFFSPDTPYDVLHTSLAEESDLVLVAPASANFIARLAAGMTSDLASSIVLVTRRPVVIVPAMNDQMYTHPLTQANINRLKEIG